MTRNTLVITVAGIAAVSISVNTIRAQYHDLPQYPNDYPNKVCIVVPPGWDESYGPINTETGIPETEPNLTMYNWENGEVRSLQYILSTMKKHIPSQTPSGEETIFIIPTVSQAAEFAEKIENDEPRGYTIDDVFVPPGSYPVHSAIFLEETQTIIGALEDCTFTYVDVIPAPPTPTLLGVISRFHGLEMPETLGDRTEWIATIAIIGILRGIHIGIALVQ